MTTSTQSSAPAPGALAPRDAGGRGLRNVLGALAGLLAAAVALGFAELTAALVGPASSPVIAVGDTVITLTPEPVKEFAIRNFGENDKIVLVAGTLVVIAVYALVIGLVALRSRRLGVLGIALFGALGAVAAITRPAGSPLDVLPSLVGAGAGILALLALLVPLTAPSAAAAPAVQDEGADTTHADERIVDRLREILGSGDRKGAPSTGAGSSSPAASPSARPRSRAAGASCCSGASTSPRPAPGSPCRGPPPPRRPCPAAPTSPERSTG